MPLWPGACPRGRDLIAESGGGGADARGASLRPALRATLSRATPLLDLPSVDVGVTSARIVGHGLKASADIFFSNCETVTFDSLRDILNPTVLKGEITLATGAMPKVTVETGQRILALLRRMAERQQALTDDEDAIEWGVTYLHSARPEECDMADRQEERWRAFSDFKRLDEDAQGEGRPPFHVRVVLVDSGGRRYIRSQLSCDYVRKTQDPRAGNNAAIVNRMMRVGWERRAKEGRINAARPGFPGQLSWAFLEVPPRWEEGQ